MKNAVEQRRNPVLASRVRVILNPRDPPGQRSIYIPPGDSRQEAYRLSTFYRFPDHNVDSWSLARSGFYFTGYKDRIKCFSCGVAVENLSRDNEVHSSNWHRQECEFANGSQAGNVPIGQRRSSSPNSPHSGGEEVNSDTRRFSTTSQGTVIHSPETTNPLIVHADPATETNHRMNSDIFPCRNPINPHMRSVETRLQTFADRATYWPAHRINATPRDIANAGFYYLGQRDRVKCWYCNGGLQNWERDDDAWTEHAKWFPMCEFVLQQKGPEFVHRIVSQFPNLRRPTLYNPSASGSNTALRESSPTAAQSSIHIIDPQQIRSDRLRKVEEAMASSELVSEARMMGFEDDEIKRALESHFESHNENFPSFEAMVEALLAAGDSSEREAGNAPEPEPAQTNRNELQELVEARLCKVCRREDSCVVFVPCGHLACCQECGERATRCPVCRAGISEKIRSFIS